MKDSKTVRLFIDTATKTFALGARVGEEKETLDLGDPKKVLERTHVGIQELGKKRKFSLADVDEFYCLLGPGSNTGIRLGLTIPRTVYAINPKIRIFGIPTRILFLSKGKSGVLSDRNGNLFYYDKDRKESHIRVRKEDISSFAFKEPIAVESSDTAAKASLEGKDIKDVSVLSLRMENRDLFIDFSDKEDEFLPEYARKI